MKTYEKPYVLVNDELAEGVYAASGCYTVDARITQSPQAGRETYTIQLNASHAASDGHHATVQIVELSFNQSVDYVSSNAANASGSGSSKLILTYAYHSNAYDNIGLGDVYVSAGEGLAVVGVRCTYCNAECDQHTW